MKIAYFINTFKSINWGGQATSTAIEYMLSKQYPEAEFMPLDMPRLPFKKIKIFRTYYEKKLILAIMQDQVKDVFYYLNKMNIPSTIFENFTHICFNGEGAIHAKSGHIVVFMGLLYIAKKQGKVVAAINQTIDLKHNKRLELLIQKVYNTLDFVAVREPISLTYAKNIGISDVHLIPDAVYGLPELTDEMIDERISKFSLPKEYVAVTGSSILKRDSTSLAYMRKLIVMIQKYMDAPIVFMANAKTDIWLAHRLQKEFGFMIVEPPVKFMDAMAIIARSKILVGGRQHPNIFAYMYKIPFIPFKGNTFKNDGVVALQNYPIKPLRWDSNESEFKSSLEEIEKGILFNKIDIEDFSIFPTDVSMSKV